MINAAFNTYTYNEVQKKNFIIFALLAGMRNYNFLGKSRESAHMFVSVKFYVVKHDVL